MPPSESSDRSGTTLANKYELVRKLGAGGMGVVYEAVNALTGRRVAVKLLSGDAEDAEARQRLLREARAGATIRHPNVVDVLDVAIDPEAGAFLVMELLDGESLEDRIDRGRLSVEELSAVLGPIAEALDLAHAAGVVHRDLKPSNIFLHRGSRGEVVPKLVDFGIARTEGSSLTRTGMMTGTVGYMSPEQMSDAKRADRQTDVWALGVVVYECLSGSMPFAGTTAVEVMSNVIKGNLIPLYSSAPRLPARLVTAVHRALSQEPGARPAGVAEFMALAGIDSERFARTSGQISGTLVAAKFPSGASAPASPPEQSRTLQALAPTVPASSPPLIDAVAVPPANVAPSAPARSGRGVAVYGGVGAVALGAISIGYLLTSREVTPAPKPAPDPETLVFEQRVALPQLEYRRVAGGQAQLGSTPEDIQAARDECEAEMTQGKCPRSNFDREAPTTTLEVRPFRLGRREVTNGELYAWLTTLPDLKIVEERDGDYVADAEGRVAALAGAQFPHVGLAREGRHVAVRAGFSNRPAVQVARRVAQRFCETLGARLPTSAEWEWAARGTDRRRYPWGNALFGCHRAVAARSAGMPCSGSPAGPASVQEPLQDETPEGVVGMSGNVAEWVTDSAEAAWSEPSLGCSSVGCFVVRGGDWSSPVWATRAAVRRVARSDFFADWLGWRCATGE